MFFTSIISPVDAYSWLLLLQFCVLIICLNVLCQLKNFEAQKCCNITSAHRNFLGNTTHRSSMLFVFLLCCFSPQGNWMHAHSRSTGNFGLCYHMQQMMYFNSVYKFMFIGAMGTLLWEYPLSTQTAFISVNYTMLILP